MIAQKVVILKNKWWSKPEIGVKARLEIKRRKGGSDVIKHLTCQIEKFRYFSEDNKQPLKNFRQGM